MSDDRKDRDWREFPFSGLYVEQRDFINTYFPDASSTDFIIAIEDLAQKEAVKVPKGRVKEIVHYLVTHPEEYIFTPEGVDHWTYVLCVMMERYPKDQHVYIIASALSYVWIVSNTLQENVDDIDDFVEAAKRLHYDTFLQYDREFDVVPLSPCHCGRLPAPPQLASEVAKKVVLRGQHIAKLSFARSCFLYHLVLQTLLRESSMTAQIKKDFFTLIEYSHIRPNNPPGHLISVVPGTLLHFVAKVGGSVEWVAILKELGVAVDFQEGFRGGNTALIWAIANGYPTVAEAIIIDFWNSANFNLQGLKHTALHVAIAKGYTNRTAQGAPINLPYSALIKRLVEKTDSNNVGKRGMTPLHLACVRRDVCSIKRLVTRGGNPYLKNDQGQSSFDLLEKTFLEACTILAQHTGGFFFLDQAEFESAYEKCLALLHTLPQP